MSFFDDGEETEPRPAARTPRAPQRPSPRRPQHAGGVDALDEHTLVVRRRVAAGIGLGVLIVIVLLVNGCLKSQKTQALKDYNRHVSEIVGESDQKVSRPLFSTLSGASAKPAVNVDDQINQLRHEAQEQAARAKGLSVPGEVAAAQRNLLLALDLRAEGVEKVANRLRTALGGGQAKQASTLIAGDMEMFLASDVVYAQRVAPLIEQTLKGDGIDGERVASSHFLPNVGWLEPSTAQSRITGQPTGQSGHPVTGNHGHALKGVSVGANTLEAEPALNHIRGGGSPTFTVLVANSGEFPETNVKVDVTVSAGAKQYPPASRLIEKTEPGKTLKVDIPVTGVPLGVAAKIQVNIEGVPGENDLENNKGAYLAIFKK